ncbi:MAG: epoxide hydrolase family protein [Pseudomonadota bacterium]
MITPFRVQVDDRVLTDLRTRLTMTRWPDEIGDHWQYGSDLTYMKSLCDYWVNGFDWRSQEARLNALDQYSTEIEGRRLHFIHQRSPHPDALPLVMTHGWPGSFAEFLHIVPMLTEPEKFGGDPSDAFHLICPSIPGYGFSEAPRDPGFDQKRVAEGQVELMRRLGYERYGVQGGDWGSPISSWTAVLAPEAVCGLHLTLVFAGYPKHKADPYEGVTDEEKARLESRRQHMQEGTGYQAIQGTRPQTLGYGLNDSPAGLAAWITEKFYAWTDCQGNLDAVVSRDDLLTNIMLYWINGNITASMRLYYESAHVQNNLFESGRIATPTGCAMFPGELYQPPRAWAAELYNIVHWTTQPRGGHFAALEVPELLAADIRQFFRSLR